MSTAEQNASGTAPRVIKRYSNRKLYDTRDSRYVTLQQIGEMVRNREDVQIIDNKTKRQVVGVAIHYAGTGEKKRLGMFVTVPLGIFLGSGVGGKIDTLDQFKLNLQSCNPHGCQGAVEITAAMLAELKKGQRLIVGFKARADSKTIGVPVSLKGLTEAVKAINIK